MFSTLISYSDSTAVHASKLTPDIKIHYHFILLPAPVTKSGLTPLGLAVSKGKLDVIKWLIDEHKVDVNGERLYDTSCSQ